MSVDLTLSVYDWILCPKADLASAVSSAVVEQVNLHIAVGMSPSQQG